MNFLTTISLIFRNHKRALVVGLIFASLCVALIYYLSKTTYYVVYIGRYETENFDRLHELALQRYVEELNAELRGVRIELKQENNKQSADESRKLYEQIANDSDVVAVIDNTHGAEFQAAASSIRNKNLPVPVININSDKSTTDYGRNVVFLGHDDTVPEKVSSFSKQILRNEEVIFIAEESYELTNVFEKEFQRTNTEIIPLYVKDRKTNNEDRTTVFNGLKNGLAKLRTKYRERGSLPFQAGDFTAGLYHKLKEGKSPSGYFRSRFAPATRQLLEQHISLESPSTELQSAVINELNDLLGGPSLFEAVRFSQVTLRSETEALLAQVPEAEELRRLNRMLLEDAYPHEIAKSQKRPTVVLNTHATWGNEIINHIDNNEEEVNILGGAYIVNWSYYYKNFESFGKNKSGNSLIILTNPSDAVTNKVFHDVNEIRTQMSRENTETDKNDNKNEDGEVKLKNDQFFVKRCLDAVSIIRGVFFDEESTQIRSSVSRSDFINFFHDKLAGKEYVGNQNELYSFSPDLLLLDERNFEAQSQERSFSYQKQLNLQMKVIPNIYFGLEIINISNIDLENRFFHADFFYWLKYDETYPDVERYIHFRNEKNQNPEKERIHEEVIDSKLYRLYKKSADFSIDVDFKKYPFDGQELKIEVEIINPVESVQISVDRADFKESKRLINKFKLDEWDTEDPYVTVDNFITSSFRGGSSQENKKLRKFKTLNVRMPINRRLTGPFVTIILPLLMIGLAALAIMYVKDNSFAHLGEVCIAIFLSIVTYSISFAQITPRSDVLTTADLLFYCTFFTVLLIFLKVVFFNSNLITDRVRNWTNEKATLTGHFAVAVYLLMIISIFIYGLA